MRCRCQPGKDRCDIRRRHTGAFSELRDRLPPLEDPVQRSFVLDTDRGEHAIGAHERVHREQPEVRRRVDHDVVVAAENRFKSFA
jgi:hypothetical protein